MTVALQTEHEIENGEPCMWRQSDTSQPPHVRSSGRRSRYGKPEPAESTPRRVCHANEIFKVLWHMGLQIFYGAA